jgi:hypothetical protein
MKVKRFDGRWDNEELDAFLEMDSISIHIRHITESDYQVRVYYDEVPFSASAMSNLGMMPQQPYSDYSQEELYTYPNYPARQANPTSQRQETVQTSPTNLFANMVSSITEDHQHRNGGLWNRLMRRSPDGNGGSDDSAGYGGSGGSGRGGHIFSSGDGESTE